MIMNGAAVVHASSLRTIREQYGLTREQLAASAHISTGTVYNAETGLVVPNLKLNAQTVRNWLDRGELRGVRVGSRRVRIRQSELDAFLKGGTSSTAPEHPEPPADEGSVTAWATFGAAMAETSGMLERAGRAELVRALEALSEATRDLAETLRRGTGETAG
jgi:excisionase family DNA binding protein